MIASALKGDWDALWRLVDDHAASPRVLDWVAQHARSGGFATRKTRNSNKVRDRNAEIAAAHTFDRIRIVRKELGLRVYGTREADIELAATLHDVNGDTIRRLVSLSPSDRRRRPRPVV